MKPKGSARKCNRSSSKKEIRPSQETSTSQTEKDSRSGVRSSDHLLSTKTASSRSIMGLAPGIAGTKPLFAPFIVERFLRLVRMMPVDSKEQPWRKWPYPLISWWEMQKFSASDFVQIMGLLGSLPNLCEELPAEAVVERRAIDGSQMVLELLEKDCGQLGLDVSARLVRETISDLSMSVAPTVGYYRQRCDQIADVIRVEMDSSLFLHVTEAQAKSLYDQMELLGPEVTRRFPSVLDDAREAGNCLALSQPTACVFHLMRVMETGVQEFGKALGVTLVDEKCWQNILDEINKAIKALPGKDSKTTELSQAAAALYSVKVAWRNQVMHPKDKYDEKEAGDILQHVKSFMGQLARII